MIFVDTNVFMYAVGKPHPLKTRAREFFSNSLAGAKTALRLCRSSAGADARVLAGTQV